MIAHFRMMGRLQAEEQLVAINVGRAVQGAGDAKGRAAIERYLAALERQIEGLPPLHVKTPAPTQRRRLVAAAGLEVRASGRTYNPLGPLGKQDNG